MSDPELKYPDAETAFINRLLEDSRDSIHTLGHEATTAKEVSDELGLLCLDGSFDLRTALNAAIEAHVASISR